MLMTPRMRPDSTMVCLTVLLSLSLLVPPDQLPHLRHPIRPAHVRARRIDCDAYRLRDVVDVDGRDHQRARHRVQRRVHKPRWPREYRAERAEHRARRGEARGQLGVKSRGEVEQRRDGRDDGTVVRVVDEACKVSARNSVSVR